jgi:hypothetical protein
VLGRLQGAARPLLRDHIEGTTMRPILIVDEAQEMLHREELALGSRLRTRLGLDAMEAIESRDIYELLTERHRRGSIVVTSSRGPDEWLATLSPGRRRPIHQQRLRHHHRRRVLPCPSETDPLGGQRRGVGYGL